MRTTHQPDHDVGTLDVGEPMPGNKIMMLDEDMDELEATMNLTNARPVTGHRNVELIIL
ncbi:unnamed protein product [Arabis nemorensis]|uniref:Uncharacterized protein n=1 Tax=Arabis nemorensis TaxID=586526 RepID=A0A565BJZ7_9BRAS|nr:unnamed protein product [Arabis nemorensis]